jgi:hypothetical protein
MGKTIRYNEEEHEDYKNFVKVKNDKKRKSREDEDKER